MSIQTNNGLPDDRSFLSGSILEHIARLLQRLARDTVAIIDVRPYKLHGFQAST
jgi:hypothetical protein